MALQRLLAGNAGNRCYFVPLDKDESCPTADLSNIGCPNGSAYLTGELLNTPLESTIPFVAGSLHSGQF